MIQPEFASKINKKLPNLLLGSFCLSQKRHMYAVFYLFMRKGYLKGDNEGKLMLDDNMLRILVINDRAGIYGE